MLKLTNSFCRYLNLAYYERIQHNKAHFKKFSHMSINQKICSGEHHQTTSSQLPFINLLQHCRQVSHKKSKNFHFKFNKNTNVTKSKQMSGESWQPSLKHVSIGGQFEVSSTDDGSSSNEWQKQYSGSGSAVNPNKETCIIPPNFRVWELVENKNDTEGNSIKFKVLSYNVLAQYLLECHPYLYTNCAPQNLTWKVRAAKLYDEITKLAPDILCLQEVQASHLTSFYAKFEQIGYLGIFKQKTGQRQDGCAIYFKKSLFELLDHVSVEFYQPELPILNRDNIGIMVKLLPKNYVGPPIVVATTHLLYNPKRTDVRLAQIQVFLAEIDRFAYYNNGKECGHLPIILTGDLNSTPDSAVIKLLDTGHVNATAFRDSSDWKKIGVTDNCQHLSVYLNRQQGLSTDFSTTKIFNSEYSPGMPDNPCKEEFIEKHFREMFNTSTINHFFNLKSTYDKQKENLHLEATTFQTHYWITVDYIYFSRCSRLKLLERLRLPTESECSVLGWLPNDVYGSDHLALAAVFELINGK